MTAIDRTTAVAAFKTYTDAYDAANPRIALKIEHTYHVAEVCDAVAREQIALALAPLDGEGREIEIDDHLL